MSGKDDKPKSAKSGAVFAGGSALAGLSAFIGASCCVLPLLLINLGVGSALVGKLAFFARAQPYFMGAAVLLLFAAAISAFWNGNRPGRRVAITLVLAAIFVAAANIMPTYEGDLLRWINR